MNGDSISLNFLSKSHRTGQWHSPNLHLTQTPLVIGHAVVNKQRGMHRLHAALSWKCFSGVSGEQQHGTLASKGKGVTDGFWVGRGPNSTATTMEQKAK